MELNPNLPQSSIPTTSSVSRPFGVGRLPGEVKEVADRPVDLDRLFGRPDATGDEVRKYEKVWHRYAAELAARRMAPKQIAETCNVSYASVLELMKNPWFQTTTLEIMRRDGMKDIMEVFKEQQFSSMVRLIEIRDDPKTPTTVARQTCVDILDRLGGKPTQKIESTVETIRSDDPVAEVARLERENGQLAARLSGADLPEPGSR